MKSLHLVLFVSLLSVAAVSAQDQAPTTTTTPATSVAGSKAKRGPVFRANKDQIVAAQTMLRTKGIYTGDSAGKLDPATRASIKSYQKENGLTPTGTLNRATLEKMGIALTDKQKAIPVSSNSYASADTAKSRKSRSAGGEETIKRNVFRATKEQIMEAQKRLKTGGLYSGEETGKLDDPTREGLKKYQEANGLKATGTLNQVTLDKMGIALTDKQKGGGAN
jgi:peptidoglycan hydrolase-like protein with peptidoglycan-binding domain